MYKYRNNKEKRCWICGGQDLLLVKSGVSPDNLNLTYFKITDANYGQTGDIFKCVQCGFRQCPALVGMLNYYREMRDEEYEETREGRAVQARQILKVVSRYQTRGRLLDVGAATGILVKEALRLGYDAQGVEPSRYLQKCAEARKIPVLLGVLPHESVGGSFDVATLIDVIEHVSDPVGLLTEIRQLLTPNGVCIIVTPDVSSVAAKLLGRRWWHYRMAHIGYFCRATLELAVANAGLRVIDTHRIGWHLPVGYVLARLEIYLGFIRWIRFPTTLQKWVIPLNLQDSILAVCVPK